MEFFALWSFIGLASTYLAGLKGTFGCITTIAAILLGPISLGILFFGIKNCENCQSKYLGKNNKCPNCIDK